VVDAVDCIFHFLVQLRFAVLMIQMYSQPQARSIELGQEKPFPAKKKKVRYFTFYETNA
jgi:hypothetical protein